MCGVRYRCWHWAEQIRADMIFRLYRAGAADPSLTLLTRSRGSTRTPGTQRLACVLSWLGPTFESVKVILSRLGHIRLMSTGLPVAKPLISDTCFADVG